MNTNEFLQEINKHRPPHLPPADNDFIKRYQLILGTGPFYPSHITTAITLLSGQEDYKNKFSSIQSKQTSASEPSPTALSQVIVIHNSNIDQCHRIRQGLFQTGLINFAGPIYVNFSPFTRRTIASLPEDSFKETDYHMEYSVFDKVDGEGKTKQFARVSHPVFFAKGLDPTVVQLYFLINGQKQPTSGYVKPLPSPLYKAFLSVDPNSSEAMMEFMNTYKVILYPMSIKPEVVSGYVHGGDKPLEMGTYATKEQLQKSWSSERNKLLGLLKAAAENRLSQIMPPPVFPICEKAVVEWKLISGYFDPSLVQAKAQRPPGIRQLLFEFNEADTSNKTIKVKRYYGWGSYILAELFDDICNKKSVLVCRNCGKVISAGKHGRPKSFCNKAENPSCFNRRNAEKVSLSKKRNFS